MIMIKVIFTFIVLLLPFKIFGEDFKIGILASLSGNWKELGEHTVKGSELAVKEINSKGGVLGQKIVLNIQDTNEATSAAKAINAYRFLRNIGFKYFIGPQGSPAGIAFSGVLPTEKDFIIISPSLGVSNFHQSSPYAFNTAGIQKYGSSEMAKKIYKLGIKKIAILSSDNPWEYEQGDSFNKTFLALGGEVTVYVESSSETNDLRTEILRIVKSKPDAIFFAVYNRIDLAAKTLKQFEFKGPKFATLVDESRLKNAQDNLDGTIYFTLGEPTDSFIEKFKNEYGIMPIFSADYAYDTVYAYKYAIEKTESFDTKEISKALLDLEFQGGSGNIKFDKEGCIVRDSLYWKVEKESLIKIGGFPKKL